MTSATAHSGDAGALDTTPSTAARLRFFVADSLTIARRSAAHIRQIPEKLIDVTVQPLMFVLLFAFVFGNVIDVPGGNYREYLIGGILVQTLTFGMMGPGVSMATDLGEGILDRFRSLPMSRNAYLFGHLTAEFVASLIAVTVMTAAGLIIGWRIHNDIPHAIAGFGILGLLSITMIWIGTFIGVSVRSSDAVQGIAFLVIFPLTFVASTFVPVNGLPSGLREFAEYNPVSCLSAAVRTLFGNPTATPGDAAWPLQHPVISSLLWCGILLAIVVPATLRAFSRRTSG